MGKWIKIDPGNEPEVIEFDDTKENWKQGKDIIGGWLELVRTDGFMEFYADEEGKWKKLPVNSYMLAYNGEKIVGTILVTGKNMGPISDEIIEWIGALK